MVPGVDRRRGRFRAVGRGRSAIGKVIGPSFKADDMPDVVSRLVEIYLELREEDERFVDTVARVGLAPFKDDVYRGAVHAHERHPDASERPAAPQARRLEVAT